MKKVSLFATLAVMALMVASCGKKDDYKSFIGTWGVEKIVYESYNTDYAGNPIQASMETSEVILDPNDDENYIKVIFKSDKTGEMRDSAIDTLWIDWNDQTHAYDSYIVCPDTTVVTAFSYSYDRDAKVLYMNMEYARTFMMDITELSSSSFSYVNKYELATDNRVYYEKATLKRLSKSPSKSASKNKEAHPHMRGSFLCDR